MSPHPTPTITHLTIHPPADHFNAADAQQYFVDDRAVMALAPDDDAAVMDFYEPWIVPTGHHTLHTRKKNLSGTYMLGTFLLADDVHLGKVQERRRPIAPPLSAPPPSPAPDFFTRALAHLPLPVLVANSTASSGEVVLKNRAYRHAFAQDEGVDAQLQAMNGLAAPGQILEKSNVVLGTRHPDQKWHVVQRPLADKELVVYAIWPQGDEAKAKEAGPKATDK